MKTFFLRNADAQEQTGSQVAPATNSAVANRRVSGARPAGLDDIDMKTDLKMPRLAILQSTSELVTNDKGKIGDLAHNITGENFGRTLEFIPLFMFKSRCKFVTGKGLVLMSRDNQTVDFGVDEFEKYIGKPVADVPHDNNPLVSAIDWDGKNPPSFTLVYNFLVLLPSRIKDFPMVLSFMKTSAPTAKDFLSMVTFSGEDMFSRVYKISNTIEKNDKGTFALPHIEFTRRCEDAEYQVGLTAFSEFHKVKKNISVELEDTAQ